MYFKVIILAAMFQYISAQDTRLAASKGYKLEYFFKTDWYTANLFCRYHGFQLATIETAEQNAFIKKLILDNGYGSEYFWTSGADLQKEGQWAWYSSGNNFQYKDWHPNQPDNANGNENCMHIWNSQKWNDAPCANQYYFICELPLCK